MTGSGTLRSPFTVAAGNNRGGIWATGGTSAADAGSVYVSTGNSALTSGTPAYDYSDGVIKLSSSTTQPTDYFAQQLARRQRRRCRLGSETAR